jgi:vitamin-K-epoxide reductase (warfarin-sensitive)
MILVLQRHRLPRPAHAAAKIRSMKYLVAVLALAGVIVSAMALRIHFMDPSLAPPCAVTERFDCGAVNHSRFAVFPPRTFDEAPGKLHVPVAAIGIVGYLIILALALTDRWWLLFEASQIGFTVATFLSFLEAFVMEKWCIYCLWSQGIATVILIVVIGVLVLRWRRGEPVWSKGRGWV